MGSLVVYREGPCWSSIMRIVAVRAGFARITLVSSVLSPPPPPPAKQQHCNCSGLRPGSDRSAAPDTGIWQVDMHPPALNPLEPALRGLLSADLRVRPRNPPDTLSPEPACRYRGAPSAIPMTSVRHVSIPYVPAWGPPTAVWRVSRWNGLRIA